MRAAAPLSLLIVSMLRCDDQIYVVGPFSSVTTMDVELVGRAYPDEIGREVVVARFDPGAGRWFDAAGQPLVIWTVQSVDNARVRGCTEESVKASYVLREFSDSPEVSNRGSS